LPVHQIVFEFSFVFVAVGPGKFSFAGNYVVFKLAGVPVTVFPRVISLFSCHQFSVKSKIK